MSLRRLALVLAAGVLGFAAVTLIALEGREVVQLRTITPEGGVRSTRTWVADADGAMWVEAANVQRPFLVDLRAHPDIELVRGGTVLPVRAVPGSRIGLVPGAGHSVMGDNPAGFLAVVRPFLARYGL